MKNVLRMGLFLFLSVLIVGAALAESRDSYNVSDWAQVYDALRECSDDRRTNVALNYSGGLDLSKERDKLSGIVYSLGVERFKWSFSGSRVNLVDLEYAENFKVCSDADEAIRYVDGLADRNVLSFRLYFTPAYAQTLFADSHYELGRLLANTRILRPNEYRYSEENCYIMFTDATFLPSDYPYSREVDSFDGFKRLFAAHTDALDRDFGAFLSKETVKALSQGVSYDRNGEKLFSNIYTCEGIMSLSYGYSNGGYYYLRDIKYYEGKLIACAWRQGTVNQLNARQKQTLDAALAIVSRTHGTPVEVEKQIHDMLCERIEYYTDDIPDDDNDCAIGALLNGKADCDGYSDAFYLCCSLAGLDVKYVHGTVLKRDDETARRTQSDRTHMWNLVRIDGDWLMADVTWDDTDNGVSYLYFNIGADRALQDHIWDDRALSVTVAGTASQGQRASDLREMTVRDWDGVYAALKDCALSRSQRLSLVCPKNLAVYENRDRLSCLLYSVGIESYNWSFADNTVELYNLVYGEEFTFCESESEIVDAINAYAERGVKSFKLCFSPAFGEKMFANERSAYNAAALKTHLASPCRYSYSDSSRYILYSDADYHASISIAEVSTLAETEKYIDSFIANRAVYIRLVCKNGLDLYGNANELSRLIWATGIKNYSWLFYTSNAYVEIFDIQY